MSFRYGMLALLGAGLSVSSPARAQVMADIHVGPGPVEGRVIVGAPHVVVREPVLVRYGISDPVVGRSYERYWHDGGGRYESDDDHRRGDRDWQRKRWNDDDHDWED